jgi:ribonuclease HII
MIAMERAVNALQHQLMSQTQVQGFKVLVDGNRCPDVENCEALIKGDLIEPVVSAASIIAKVTRDRQMKELDQIYPEYGFSRHKGYGTKEHLEALTKYGPISGQHRLTFGPVKRLIRA